MMFVTKSQRNGDSHTTCVITVMEPVCVYISKEEQSHMKLKGFNFGAQYIVHQVSMMQKDKSPYIHIMSD